MNRLERAGWFAGGAGATALAAPLVLMALSMIRAPAHESNGAIAVNSDALIVQQLERINERLERLELRPAIAPPLAPEPQEPDRRPNAESYEASMAAGREIVDRAIQAGSWSHMDAAAFAATTSNLDMSDRLALHQRVIAAINEDRVQVQGFQPLR